MGKTNEVGHTEAANMAGNNVPTTVAPRTETPEEKVEGEVTEDRENSTYFSTWGSVAPRSTPGKSFHTSRRPYTFTSAFVNGTSHTRPGVRCARMVRAVMDGELTTISFDRSSHTRPGGRCLVLARASIS